MRFADVFELLGSVTTPLGPAAGRPADPNPIRGLTTRPCGLLAGVVCAQHSWLAALPSS